MRIGPIEIRQVQKVNPTGIPAKETLTGPDGQARYGQMIGVIGLIANGYILSLGTGRGEIAEVRFAATPEAIGAEVASFVARKELEK